MFVWPIEYFLILLRKWRNVSHIRVVLLLCAGEPPTPVEKSYSPPSFFVFFSFIVSCPYPVWGY